MDPITLSFNPKLARMVTVETLVPHQQNTRFNFQSATDFYQQTMIKHPYRSDFHSRAEWLNAGLLEGDPTVTSYVPQPFQLRIRRDWYKPDCYVVADNQPRRVIELKPRGEFLDDKRIPLEHFFAQHGMQFMVISNEAVFEREIEALNWLEIVKSLHMAKHLITTQQEEAVLDNLVGKTNCQVQLGDLIDPGDRETNYITEIAVYRLLHQGHIHGQLTTRPLDWDTEVSL